MLKDPLERHPNGPLEFQSLASLNSKPPRKQRPEGAPAHICMVSQSVPCCSTLECGKIGLTFSKDMFAGTGHRKSEKRLKS